MNIRCAEEGCKAQPSFNFPDKEFSLYCKAHMEPGMVSCHAWLLSQMACELTHCKRFLGTAALLPLGLAKACAAMQSQAQ